MWHTLVHASEELVSTLWELLPNAEAAPAGSSLVLGLLVLVLLPFLLHLTAEGAAAAGVVGSNGDPSTCTEAALNTALIGGGLVTFDCGPAQKIINLTSQKTISADTTINGGDLVALSGGNTTRLILVSANHTLTLQHLVLSNGQSCTSPGFCNLNGGAISNGGTLNLDHATVQNSTAGQNGGRS